jgi:hypothetical protein
VKNLRKNGIKAEAKNLKIQPEVQVLARKMKARKKGAEKRCEKIRLSPSTIKNTRNGWEELTVHKGTIKELLQ